jgi:hypothetical protein
MTEVIPALRLFSLFLHSDLNTTGKIWGFGAIRLQRVPINIHQQLIILLGSIPLLVARARESSHGAQFIWRLQNSPNAARESARVPGCKSESIYALGY